MHIQTYPKRALLAALIGGLLAGCASQGVDMRGKVADMAKQAVQQAAKAEEPVLEERDESYVKARFIDRNSGDVSLRAGAAPFHPLMSNLCAEHGFSLMLTDGVNFATPVSVDIRNASAEAAIRQLALAAGYVAVIDDVAKSVTLSPVATKTFRLPLHVMQKLTSTYTVGGNPIASGGGASSSGAGGGGPGQSGIKADFTVTSTYTTNASTLSDFIRQIAGTNADVRVQQELGYVSVRSNAVALKRVEDFLVRFSEHAMRRVEIEASVIEVELGNEFEYGIDWTRVLSSGKYSVGLIGASSVANPATQVKVTSASNTAVINALQKLTNVNVITQPRVVAMNNTPSVIFEGSQIPYLGNLTSTQSTTAGGLPTISGSTSWAVDGITLSIQPDIFSKDEVQLTLIPVLSSVGSFSTFDLGSSGTLTAPKQTTKQAVMQVVAQTGQTLILGGIRSSTDSRDKTGLPGLVKVPGVGDVLASQHNATEKAREVVILIRANVLPAPKFNPMFSESI